MSSSRRLYIRMLVLYAKRSLHNGNLTTPRVTVPTAMPGKVLTALEPDPRSITALQKIGGGLCLVVFVATWICSILSPLVLAYAVFKQYHLLTFVVITTSITAYLPWKKGILANSVRYFIKTFTPCYFKSIVLLFQGEGHLPNQKDPQTFYAIHPHGAFCVGWAMLFCHDVMQHVRFCFAPALYLSPFFRLFARVTGNPGSAAKFAMISYMKNGESLALPPGGFEEATLTSLDIDRVFIRKRTGFIRLCLTHGIRVRPVYVFGEKGLYWNLQGFFSPRLAVNRFGIPALVPWGTWFCPILPKGTVDIRIVVGPPIDLPRIHSPSKDDVKKYHDKYVAALVKLFDEHKEAAYGPAAKGVKLEVW